MNLTKLLKTAEKFTVDNSPTILTAVGVVGTVATAYLTHKATFSATLEMTERDSAKKIKGEPPLTRTEIVKHTWMYYLPPVASGTITIGAIIFANRISTKRAAALAAAYAISEGRLSEYKEKMVEKLGVNKEQKARDEIAQSHIDRNPVGKNEIIVTGGGEVLCFDKYTGRYFVSSMEALRKAENDINFYILNNDYANLNDFYRLIGLPTVPVGEEVGWTPEFNFEILYSTTISENGKPCIVTDYQVCGVRRRPSSPGLKAVGKEE